MNGTAENLNLVYTLDGTIYINLTNQCTNRCLFCIRSVTDNVEGKNLWLSSEDYVSEDVINQLKNIVSQNSNANEIVFCGFGEPLIKFDIFCEVSQFIKSNYPNMKIRVNTNGQANLFHKKNIIPELKKYVNAVSVSLNGDSIESYNLVSQPRNKEASYNAVKDFIKECVISGIDTTATIVSGCEKAPVDIEKCKEITNSLGAKFRIREWLPKGY